MREIIVIPEDGEDEDLAEAAEAAIRAAADAVVDGIYFYMPDKVYHAVHRLSSTFLKKMDISPADAWKDSWMDPNPTVLTEEQAKVKEKAKRLGSAYHSARLEPELFEALYVREIDRRDYPRGGLITSDASVKAALKEMGQQQTVIGESTLDRAHRLLDAGHEGVILAIEQAAWEAERNGRIPIGAKDWDDIVIDMQRIRSSGSIHEKLSGGAAEVSIFWTDRHGLPMKTRLDYLRPDSWQDLKTFANPNGKRVLQAINDAFRYNRYHMQAVVQRDAIQELRNGRLPIIGDATDDQRALIAKIAMSPEDLKCWFIFQQKGGVPNLIAREFIFFHVTAIHEANWDAGAAEEDVERGHAAVSQRTALHQRGWQDVANAKREFVHYSQVYEPGQPWRPLQDEGPFEDLDFSRYWLDGTA